MLKACNMSLMRIFLVHLRKSRVRSDKREDPFWEFGSFGVTECHHANLLHPDRAEKLVGARLGFCQPGPLGTKLLFITPPLRVGLRRKARLEDLVETLWRPVRMPFTYEAAPTLADSRGHTDFPLLRSFLRGVAGETAIRKFAAKFRANCHPLPAELSREVWLVYSRKRKYAQSDEIARSYIDALPCTPTITYDRTERYEALRRRAGPAACKRSPVKPHVGPRLKGKCG
jgi:hypothetical protein